jgi:DNA-binding NtrC family response regulator
MSAHQARILFLEDEKDLREVLAESLSDEGFLVDAFPDSREALMALGQERYDVILTDISMPGDRNGLDFVAAVRAESRKTPIVVYSAFGDSKTLRQALELGVTKFLSKPTPVEDIRDALYIAVEESMRIAQIEDALIRLTEMAGPVADLARQIESNLGKINSHRALQFAMKK